MDGAGTDDHENPIVAPGKNILDDRSSGGNRFGMSFANRQIRLQFCRRDQSMGIDDM